MVQPSQAQRGTHAVVARVGARGGEGSGRTSKRPMALSIPCFLATATKHGHP